jgi:hypothetical protein
MVNRHSADPSRSGLGGDPSRSGLSAQWSRGSLKRTCAGLAATSRLRSLFPADLAVLEEDEGWTGVARVVREQTAEVIAAGQYPFEAFYTEDPVAVDQVAAEIFDAVIGRYPPAKAEGAVNSDADLRQVVDHLIWHRLQVSSADRAGRRLVMPSSGFDLAAWAWRIRMSPIGKEMDDLLAFSDQEIGYFVSRRQDAVVVEMTSRSRQRWLLGNFDTEQNALRFLVLRIGADWRSTMGRRALTGMEPVYDLEIEDGPTATHLTWSGGWTDFPKGLAGRSAALTFGRMVGRPIDQVAALYENPNGQLPTTP